MGNPEPRDDTWAMGPIGSPFPENPIRVMGQPNMYVALWYKNGKPLHGRAWNNGGVIECSFAYNKVELTGIKDLGGLIQILQYTGNHNTLGFWYQWIKYKNRFEKYEERQVVKCGNSLPIFWRDRKEGPLLGYLDNSTEIAYFSHDGIAEQLEGPELDNMWIIIRNIKGGPPHCKCKKCPKAQRKKHKKTEKKKTQTPTKPPNATSPITSTSERLEPQVIMADEWTDLRMGDPWPADMKLIKALGRSLNTIKGENSDQYVAVWYRDEEPIMGRAWNENGNIAARFGWAGREYSKKIGSLQLLVELIEYSRGFEYDWIKFGDYKRINGGNWSPVHIESKKVIIAPCVLHFDGKEILGKMDVGKKEASAAFGGKDNIIQGPEVDKQLILCRRIKVIKEEAIGEEEISPIVICLICIIIFILLIRILDR